MATQHDIDAIRRTVGYRPATDDTGNRAFVTLSRTYPTDVADLWAAITDSERLAKWIGILDGNLRPGGTYWFESESGKIFTCEPPRSLDVAWGPEGRLEVRLQPEGDRRARIDLTRVVPFDALWADAGPARYGIYWDIVLEVGLGGHLGIGPALTPDELSVWPISSEGQAFVTAVGRAWERVDPEGGARRRADRAIDYYT